IRGELVKVRGRKRPIDLLFNLDHPDQPTVLTEVNDNGGDDEEEEEDVDELIHDETDSSEDELQKRFNKMTFVVATRKLERLPQWVKVTDVFKSDSDAAFLKQAGVSSFDDPNYERYSRRLARLRAIRRYMYRMDVLERELSYDEVTEIFVRGDEVERYFREGKVKEIAGYCQTDIINTYRVWLRYELFRGTLSQSAFEASQRNLADFVNARDARNADT